MNLDSSSSDDEEIRLMFEYNIIRRPRIVRERPDYLEEYDDLDFFNRFRLTKLSVLELLVKIEDRLETPTDINNAIPPMNQLLLTLRFYATGCMLITAGDFAGVHKSTACKIVHRVTAAIAGLRPTYISVPQLQNDIKQAQQNFFQLARFPRVVGALDCTHIAIQSPGGENAEVFRNRKGYFSINVQTLSSADLRILDIVARWPGSTHDATIFNNSALCGHFEARRMGNSLIVADSGYGVRSYLMTPLTQTTNHAQELYNESLIRTRNVVERQYGVWKRRFPVLALGMRVNLRHVQPIIVATAVLHNIACMNNEVLPPEDPEVIEAIDFENGLMNQGNGMDNQRGARVRTALVNNYFHQLAQNV